MATSSQMSTSNGYIKYTISITQNSQNTTSNNSNVTVSVRFFRTNTGYETYGSGTVYCKINGTTYSATVTSSQKITNAGITLFSKTLDIAHNSDGTKTLTCSAWIDHSRVSSNEQSYSQALTTIPRQSSFGTISGTTIGGNCTVNINRNVNSYTHQLWYKVGNGSWIDVGSGIGTQKTFEIRKDQCNQITTSASGTMQLCLRTFNGQTAIGTDVYLNVTVSVPADAKPSCTVSVTDTSGLATKFGGYVQGFSKAQITVTPTRSYNSPIASYSISANGATYTTTPATTGGLTKVGNNAITAKVTDQRGRSGSATATINVLAYSIPSVLGSVIRCTEDGTEYMAGEYCKVTYSASLSSLGGKNSKKSFVIRYKPTNASKFTEEPLPMSGTSASGSYTFRAAGDTPYNVEIVLADQVTSVTAKTQLSTAISVFHFNATGKGLGIFHLSTKEQTVEVGYPLYCMETKLVYCAGDTANVRTTCAGLLTSNKTQICFSIPLSKPIAPSVKTVSVSCANLMVRAGTGGYLHSGDSMILMDVSVYITENGLYVVITKSDGYTDFENNISLSVYGTFTIEFEGGDTNGG